jgi:hypothetical protein
MLLIKELAAVYPNTNTLARRVVEVCAMRLRSVLNPDLCRSHIRHIYVLSSEPKPWVMRVTTKPLITSLPLSTRVRSHRKTFNSYTMTLSWCVNLMHT